MINFTVLSNRNEFHQNAVLIKFDIVSSKLVSKDQRLKRARRFRGQIQKKNYSISKIVSFKNNNREI